MKINQNMSAVVTNNQLLRTENNLTAAMEKLSSGLKINHAKDDAAGIAISNKMKLQIEGLDQASRNASDGTSVLQTVDGALGEVTSIIQRMRELAVQAANDINTSEDKQAAQNELSSLRDEIDRISRDTEFNTKSLLDGTLQQRTYAKNVSRISTTSDVPAGSYSVAVTNAATKAQNTADSAAFNNLSATVGAAGAVNINGSSVEILATDTYEEALEKVRTAAENGNANVELEAGTLQIESSAYGNKASISLEFSSITLANALGYSTSTPASSAGTDAVIDLTEGFEDTATKKVDGNHVTITDKNGFEMSFLINDGYESTGSPLEFDVTNIGAMTLQIGANQHQTMEVSIPEISSEMLYIDELNLTTVDGAENAIEALDEALAKISAARASIGAYENRLDYAVDSLDATSQNMTSALSRIEDVDMAEAMTEYTQQNVLQQAGISVLTQANDLPQQVLQLLQ